MSKLNTFIKSNLTFIIWITLIIISGICFYKFSPPGDESIGSKIAVIAFCVIISFGGFIATFLNNPSKRQ
jgi:hypothetical protein